ncbi:hypothetical protein [Archangium lipolyticum]|uniref:hypothetical protein n=1 Tax=Archangium lipolyticum TaxID=2970465 RepID=UPI00214C2345|nr:hypothetical protein [Archangium lipolyticum]
MCLRIDRATTKLRDFKRRSTREPDSQDSKQRRSILHQTLKHPAARALFLEFPLAEFSLFAKLRSSLLASLSPKAGSLRDE